MGELEYWAEKRADVPDFAGGSLREKLWNGHAEAAKRLARYVGDFRYNADEAASIMLEIQAWSTAHRASLTEEFKSGGDLLPEELRLELGQKKTQQYLLAIFSDAESGIPAWESGIVADNVAKGVWSDGIVRQDADSRLGIFGEIVKLDDEGTLAQIFGKTEENPYVIAAIVVGAAAIAAGLYFGLVQYQQIQVTGSALNLPMCKSDDPVQQENCIKLQETIAKNPAMGPPVIPGVSSETGSVIKWLAVALIVGALVYGGVTLGGPYLRRSDAV